MRGAGCWVGWGVSGGTPPKDGSGQKPKGHTSCQKEHFSPNPAIGLVQPDSFLTFLMLTLVPKRPPPPHLGQMKPRKGQDDFFLQSLG